MKRSTLYIVALVLAAILATAVTIASRAQREKRNTPAGAPGTAP